MEFYTFNKDAGTKITKYDFLQKSPGFYAGGCFYAKIPISTLPSYHAYDNLSNSNPKMAYSAFV